MNIRPDDIRLAGAVDLSTLRPQPTSAEQPVGSVNVVDVSEASFASEVVDRSRTVPVVLDFWADWCQPCKQLGPLLERLAAEGGGAWVLARIDCDANPRLAQAAGVQGIPAVRAVVDGAVVGEFTGALPEPEVREFIRQVLALAAGAPGTGQPTDPAGGQPAVGGPGPPTDPGHAEAEAALARGDVAGALTAFRGVLQRDPTDPVARAALPQLELIERAQRLDPTAVRRRAQVPDDLDAQLDAADLDMAEGRPDQAYQRLLALIRTSTGPTRDRARARLVTLLDVLPPDDPRVLAARRELANALY